MTAKKPTGGKKRKGWDLNLPEIVIGTPKMGRPTLYDARFCEMVIELGRQGKSKTQIAAHIGISRETIYQWAEIHKDFSDALTQAHELAQAWWEEAGQQGIFRGPGFNDRAWSLQVRNRFPGEYKESRELEVAGKGGGPIQLTISSDDDQL